ncbi:MAG: class II aldolase/adducin family protein [Rhodospirillales bacterium]|nr:class II aldolase/adducin family protein [Rhodospirillales bacterium]
MAVSTLAAAHAGIEHRDERIDLACAFRWAARWNMHESVANHFSYAVSEDGSRFLVNPRGRHFSRVRASELLLTDANDPSVMDRPDAPDPSAWALHGGIHRRVPHARAILHVHSKYATALASLKDPMMLPIENNTMRFHERIAYDLMFDGMGVGDEAERVAAIAGDKPILLLGNHGVMVLGQDMAQALDDLYYFERACETLIIAMQTGRELSVVSHAVASKMARQWAEYPDLTENHFKALKEILDEEEPDYRN